MPEGPGEGFRANVPMSGSEEWKAFSGTPVTWERDIIAPFHPECFVDFLARLITRWHEERER